MSASGNNRMVSKGTNESSVGFQAGAEDEDPAPLSDSEGMDEGAESDMGAGIVESSGSVLLGGL